MLIASIIPVAVMPYALAIAFTLIPIYVWDAFARTPKGRR